VVEAIDRIACRWFEKVSADGGLRQTPGEYLSR